MDDLLLTSKPHKTKVKGMCVYHMQYFNTELELERDRVPSQGHFVCMDCKKKKMAEREMGYRRKRFATSQTSSQVIPPSMEEV